jgi:hypothetical protein
MFSHPCESFSLMRHRSVQPARLRFMQRSIDSLRCFHASHPQSESESHAKRQSLCARTVHIFTRNR